MFTGACHTPSDVHTRVMYPLKPSLHIPLYEPPGSVSGYVTPSSTSAGHFSVSRRYARPTPPRHCDITGDHSPVFRHAR